MTLDELRQAIDDTDAQILALLQARARLVAQAWTIKAELGMPERDTDRERAILARLHALNAGSGLDPTVVEAVFAEVIGAVCRPDRA